MNNDAVTASLAEIEIARRAKGYFDTAVETQNIARGLGLGYVTVADLFLGGDIANVKAIEGSTARACLEVVRR